MNSPNRRASLTTQPDRDQALKSTRTKTSSSSGRNNELRENLSSGSFITVLSRDKQPTGAKTFAEAYLKSINFDQSQMSLLDDGPISEAETNGKVKAAGACNMSPDETAADYDVPVIEAGVTLSKVQRRCPSDAELVQGTANTSDSASGLEADVRGSTGAGNAANVQLTAEPNASGFSTNSPLAAVAITPVDATQAGMTSSIIDKRN